MTEERVQVRFLVDGHNLVPHIPGLSLDMLDDEEQLIKKLQDFCRQGRHQVEVYFDGTPPDHAGRRRYGAVTGVFVRKGRIADDAIRKRIKHLGVQARQWTLVSSDQAVQAAGREVHMEVISSAEFAKRMYVKVLDGQTDEKPDGDSLNPDQVDEWMNIFKLKRPT